MKLVAQSQHQSVYPEPIGFESGDRLVLGESDKEFPGWVWVTTPNGNQGWAPEQYIEVGSNSLESFATRDYTARELCTEAGDILLLHHELNQWGWVENSDGDTGWVPLNTTRPL
jgi:hypothetical protein